MKFFEMGAHTAAPSVWHRLRMMLPYLLILAVGIFIGWFSSYNDQPELAYGFRDQNAGYRFINPLIFIKTPEEQAFPQYESLKETFDEYVSGATAEQKAADISVYFRNLNTSQWVAVNPEQKFSPASMLKVLTLTSVLKEAEGRPELLSLKVNVGDVDEGLNNMYFPPSSPVRTGETYTVDELLERLIVESDNIALLVLDKIIGEEKIKKTYDSLEIAAPDQLSDNLYTVKEYSRLFRTLYNGTYLSRAFSEKALELLSRTTFTQGIAAGVPAGIDVSHKFGTRTFPAQSSAGGDAVLSELHNCGIVYHPESPYFLCVMTKGKDFKDLESVIRDISRLTWQHMENVELEG